VHSLKGVEHLRKKKIEWKPQGIPAELTKLWGGEGRLLISRRQKGADFMFLKKEGKDRPTFLFVHVGCQRLLPTKEKSQRDCILSATERKGILDDSLRGRASLRRQREKATFLRHHATKKHDPVFGTKEKKAGLQRAFRGKGTIASPHEGGRGKSLSGRKITSPRKGGSLAERTVGQDGKKGGGPRTGAYYRTESQEKKSL